jgi:hypothetical protein
MCERFKENVINKIVDNINCSCEPKNFIHYDNTICEIASNLNEDNAFLYGLNGKLKKGYVDILISCLHNKQNAEFCRIFRPFVKFIDMDVKKKILSHKDCYNLDNLFLYYRRKIDLNMFLVVFSCYPDTYFDQKIITFKDWFELYFEDES